MAFTILALAALIATNANIQTPAQPSFSDSMAIASQGVHCRPGYYIIFSTDIRGTNPDGFQSMLRLLLYANI